MPALNGGCFMERNNVIGIVLAVVAFLYVLSPIDGMPGPIDDVIVALIGIVISRKQIGAND
jgi:sorbitol-specific phosphotransferase system component IIBC